MSRFIFSTEGFVDVALCKWGIDQPTVRRTKRSQLKSKKTSYETGSVTILVCHTSVLGRNLFLNFSLFQVNLGEDTSIFCIRQTSYLHGSDYSWYDFRDVLRSSFVQNILSPTCEYWNLSWTFYKFPLYMNFLHEFFSDEFYHSKSTLNHLTSKLIVKEEEPIP